jgi:hypothetical protein
MTYRHIAGSQFFKCFFCKNIGNKANIIMVLHQSFITHSDTAAFLPSMLQSIKSKITKGRCIHY